MRKNWQTGAGDSLDPLGLLCCWVTAYVDFFPQTEQPEYMLAIAVGYDPETQKYTVWDPDTEADDMPRAFYQVPYHKLAKYPKRSPPSRTAGCPSAP